MNKLTGKQFIYLGDMRDIIQEYFGEVVVMVAAASCLMMMTARCAKRVHFII